jgi:predicted Zn-ribbon and HTH transcriptional regulator
MSEHAVYNGLQELEKTGDGFKLVVDKSLPVLPFICESCGYVELRIPSLIGK